MQDYSIEAKAGQGEFRVKNNIKRKSCIFLQARQFHHVVFHKQAITREMEMKCKAKHLN